MRALAHILAVIGLVLAPLQAAAIARCPECSTRAALSQPAAESHHESPATHACCCCKKDSKESPIEPGHDGHHGCNCPHACCGTAPSVITFERSAGLVEFQAISRHDLTGRLIAPAEPHLTGLKRPPRVFDVAAC